MPSRRRGREYRGRRKRGGRRAIFFAPGAGGKGAWQGRRGGLIRWEIWTGWRLAHGISSVLPTGDGLSYERKASLHLPSPQRGEGAGRRMRGMPKARRKSLSVPRPLIRPFGPPSPRWEKGRGGTSHSIGDGHAGGSVPPAMWKRGKTARPVSLREEPQAGRISHFPHENAALPLPAEP